MGEPVDVVDAQVIREQIRDFIRTNFLVAADAPAINDDVSLIEQDIVDQTGILELVLFVEETYGISVPEDDLIPEHFDTVTSLTTYVADRLAE